MTRSLKSREDRLRARIEARRRVGTGEAAEKVCASRVVGLVVFGRTSRVMLNCGEAVPVRYAVVEAEWLITSHHGPRYERDARYPVEAQPRDYTAELELQLAVEERAGSLDPWRLLTDSVLPIDGPPVVRRDGVVISGNGRTQSMRLAIDRGLYTAVLEGILERCKPFGVDALLVSKLRSPILIRLMENDVTSEWDLARYGIEMNRDPGLGMSSSEQSMGLARMMTKGVVDQLAGLVATLPEGYTVREFMRSRAADIAVVLSPGGLVDARKRAAYFTPGGDLTEAAKELVETTLAGLTVRNIEVIRRASRSTRDRLVRVGIEFMRMRSAGEQWDLSAFNDEAVRIMTEAEGQSAYLRTLNSRPGASADSLVERLLHPERFANVAGDFGFRGQRAPHPSVEALALCLERNPRDYATVIAEYAARATGSWKSMFECLEPAEVFSETIGRYAASTVC